MGIGGTDKGRFRSGLTDMGIFVCARPQKVYFFDMRQLSSLSSILSRIGLIALCLLGVPTLFSTASAATAERDRIEAFLNVTGFDVALDSIALSAGSAPQMLGIDADTFGSDWERLSDEVFDLSVMHNLALEILEQTLTDDILTHSVNFYASELGQRLVEVENQSHLDQDDNRESKGRELIMEMKESNEDRLRLLERMNSAIDSSGTSLRAIQEIQLRFLLAAAAAGVVELQMDPEDLRRMFKAQEPDLLPLLKQTALAHSAFTYRDFSDADLEVYVDALEKPEMRQVYELLNAVQYEIMANRFEVLAMRMAELHPGQDI
jgi:hypothetical protein